MRRLTTLAVIGSALLAALPVRAAPPPASPTAPASSTSSATATAAESTGSTDDTSGDRPSKSGFSFALRTGFAVGFGTIAKVGPAAAQRELKPNDSSSGAIPLWLDVGYRINPNIYVGAFFQYSYLLVKKGGDSFCPDRGDPSCSSGNIRIAANAHYHFLPDAKFDPWAGLGIGYEIQTANLTSGPVESKNTFSGLFVSLQGGGDYMLSPKFGLWSVDRGFDRPVLLLQRQADRGRPHEP